MGESLVNDSDMARPERREQHSKSQLILSEAEMERQALLVAFQAEQILG